VQLAERVGGRGKVFAEDIDAAALNHLRGRCDRWGLTHVSAVLGTVTDPRLPAGALDLIFVISSYHHFEDPVLLMRNARAALKPGGRLAIAEWLGDAGTRPEVVETQMKAAGYRLERIDRSLEANNLYIYLFGASRDVLGTSRSLPAKPCRAANERAGGERIGWVFGTISATGSSVQREPLCRLSGLP
jgi:SAM-dependent methyltransferase